MSIASEIERLQEAKSCIKCSIEDQWVSVPNDLKLQWYSECIRAIQSWWEYTPQKSSQETTCFCNRWVNAWSSWTIPRSWLYEYTLNTPYYSWVNPCIIITTQWWASRQSNSTWSPHSIWLRCWDCYKLCCWCYSTSSWTHYVWAELHLAYWTPL
jgi:hypothetical protein